MKKILLCTAVLFSMVFTSCEDEEAQVYNPADGDLAYFTAGTQGKLPIKEEAVSGSYLITVGSTTLSDTDRAISVEVVADNTTATAAQYTIDATTLVIPAGSYTGQVKVTSVYNELPPVGEFALLGLKLSAVDGSEIVSEQGSDEFSLRIFRSCALTNFPLTYNVQVSAFGDAAPSHDETLVPLEDENTYTLPSSWGTSFVAWATGDDSYEGEYPYSGTLVINCDNTVSFTNDDASLYPGGEGLYDPSTGIIQLEISQGLFTGDFTVSVSLIPID